MGLCPTIGQGERGAERAMHTIISLNRREMDQKMCSPNILGSGYILAAAWYRWPIVTFFSCISLPAATDSRMARNPTAREYSLSPFNHSIL